VATLTFTVPNAALAVLDAYAQEKQFADFHAYVRQWMKNSYRNARREKNRLDAADLLSQEPPDPVIT
jgi:TfoX/Sxy family transcriptional regulator of competence genes